MLYNDVNEFNWTTDNFGATFSEAGFGTQLTTGAANTKGAAVELLAAVAEDVYGIAITFGAGATSGAARQFMADLLVDEAGGSSYSVRIANLMVDAPNFNLTGYQYYFPLFIKSGSSIGVQAQCQAATQTMRCGVKVFGKPSHPHLISVGTRVETFGADTATTTGTGITPGTNALGSYTASVGTTTNNNWWWQMGYVVTDTSIVSANYHFDVKAGDGSNDKICMDGVLATGTGSEQMSKSSLGYGLPIRRIVAGSNVYVRSAAINTTPDTGLSVCVYALG